MKTKVDRSECVPVRGGRLVPLLRTLLMALALLAFRADYASAVSYNRVVALGDSLLDEAYDPFNAPLVSQQPGGPSQWTHVVSLWLR